MVSIFFQWNGLFCNQQQCNCLSCDDTFSGYLLYSDGTMAGKSDWCDHCICFWYCSYDEYLYQRVVKYEKIERKAGDYSFLDNLQMDYEIRDGYMVFM